MFTGIVQTLGRVAGIAQRAIDQSDVVLVLGEDGNRYALATVQIAFLAPVRLHPFGAGFCQRALSLAPRTAVSRLGFKNRDGYQISVCIKENHWDNRDLVAHTRDSGIIRRYGKLQH